VAASGGASVRDTLQMHWLGDCTCIWHPVDYETFSQAVNFELMFSNLIDHNWTSETTVEFGGDLAESWSTPDAKVYTFKLHSGVKWHDGQPFSADDVIWTINESQKWSPGRYKVEAWDALLGAKDVRDGPYGA
jgi:ABC-type transport system substrate-binding protein